MYYAQMYQQQYGAYNPYAYQPYQQQQQWYNNHQGGQPNGFQQGGNQSNQGPHPGYQQGRMHPNQTYNPYAPVQGFHQGANNGMQMMNQPMMNQGNSAMNQNPVVNQMNSVPQDNQQQKPNNQNNKQGNNKQNRKGKNNRGGGKNNKKDGIPEHIRAKLAEIDQMQSPEEIERYIAERRMRYPTRENIKKKEEKLKAMEERGEVSDISEFRSKKKRKRESQGDSNKRTKMCRFYLQDRCKSGESCRFSHDYKPPKRNFLESNIYTQLHAKAVAFEKQSLLQCIHYIISNNFLQDPKDSVAEGATENNEEATPQANTAESHPKDPLLTASENTEEPTPQVESPTSLQPETKETEDSNPTQTNEPPLTGNELEAHQQQS
eukprot:TRINITY_DN7889_c0_g1_i1.p1 TRINITY_DN7889_c0_g1~~TRINITY_DN7889_c0_g1_i1.p1  ORF type:complete len:390 (+),score=96.85 TRINITY_DN7889_c0_g1_i1:42-1172(+)